MSLTAAVIIIAIVVLVNIALTLFIFEKHSHLEHEAEINYKSLCRNINDVESYLLRENKENRGDLNILAEHLGYKFDTIPQKPSKRILRELKDDSKVAEGVNQLEDI